MPCIVKLLVPHYNHYEAVWSPFCIFWKYVVTISLILKVLDVQSNYFDGTLSLLLSLLTVLYPIPLIIPDLTGHDRLSRESSGQGAVCLPALSAAQSAFRVWLPSPDWFPVIVPGRRSCSLNLDLPLVCIQALEEESAPHDPSKVDPQNVVH